MVMASREVISFVGFHLRLANLAFAADWTAPIIAHKQELFSETITDLDRTIAAVAMFFIENANRRTATLQLLISAASGGYFWTHAAPQFTGKRASSQWPV